jgi:hypothetical protein
VEDGEVRNALDKSGWDYDTVTTRNGAMTSEGKRTMVEMNTNHLNCAHALPHHVRNDGPAELIDHYFQYPQFRHVGGKFFPRQQGAHAHGERLRIPHPR